MNIPQLAAETEPPPDAGMQEGDLSTVSGQGISFRLFNYSTNINKSAGNATWRPISSYFTFRNSRMENGADAATVNIPAPATNSAHDQDGYTKYHATVERVLNGYPVLDFTRNADGTERTDPGVAESVRSLAYLFSSGDHAVTAYTPVNTILQQSGSHYWYDSADHAVDYDISANRFRLRSYVERNSVTASYGTSYGDFLPFTYTGGNVVNTTEAGVPYHVDTDNTDYWFGMTMQVNFFQTKNGKLGDQNMIFSFSGDDDVWVFVDDVLILDLGGTHGTVNGSINFATGEVLQYLSWGGANATAAERTGGSATSFPTSLRACFDAAGRMPNGGWSPDGKTFADYSEHTLKFYYLERGSAVANCSLDFRLPTLPDESLTVTKDLSPAENEVVRDFVADSLYYRFRVMKADAAGNATEEPFLTSGTTYGLLQNGSKAGTGTVGEDHCFYLKAGQSAQFTQMLRKGNGATRYVVEELLPDELTGQYAGVEYLLSGAGGDTVTEDHPAEAITAFRTGVLSAEQTQTVTFRNRVDTSKLGTLKITKQAAPGTVIPSELFFQMQVMLGEKLIPAGTHYRIGEERRTVETAGILLLRAGETAVIEQGILSGTTYQVTEISAALDGFRPSYTGTVEPTGEISCTQDGASGVFPLSGTVHVTVTNADYDFAVQIPIYKTVLDYQERSTFFFAVEQVVQSEDSWQVVDTLPEIAITVSGDQAVAEYLTIGYRTEEEGVFCYRITEKSGNGNYLYDTSAFFVEVTVAGGTAYISGIYKNGIEESRVSFINRAVTNLTVTKMIAGPAVSLKFPFTAEVFLDGEAFILPEPAGNSGYTVQGNRISFSLGHGESITLPHIPIGAVVNVEEHDYEGFLVFHTLEGVDETQASGGSREIQFSNTPQTIHFTNQSGFRLPSTGGAGTVLYTAGGTALSAGMSAALLYKRSRSRKRKETPEA
ncbi:MAG: LPXTG cell wall anchor domain-containing protein [Oscillospiraceae bacterium]|nr:LPXTG cell wall anchor domain-containing protein [Oscillospiraceae bacterium]